MTLLRLWGQIQNLRELKFCNILLPQCLIGVLWVMLATYAQSRISGPLDQSELDAALNGECVMQFHQMVILYYNARQCFAEAGARSPATVMINRSQRTKESNARRMKIIRKTMAKRFSMG